MPSATSFSIHSTMPSFESGASARLATMAKRAHSTGEVNSRSASAFKITPSIPIRSQSVRNRYAPPIGREPTKRKLPSPPDPARAVVASSASSGERNRHRLVTSRLMASESTSSALPKL